MKRRGIWRLFKLEETKTRRKKRMRNSSSKEMLGLTRGIDEFDCLITEVFGGE